MAPSTRNKILLTVLGLAIIGFIDASYLTWQHYAHRIPPCTIHGCETVLTSKYATVGPIPIASFGMGYYAVVIILAAMMFEGRRSLWPWLMTLVGVAIIATLGLVYLQGFVIHAWCQYCLLSAGITVAMFGLILSLRPGFSSKK